MKLLKLVVHPLFILLIIVAVAIYINRAELLNKIDDVPWISKETADSAQQEEAGETEETATAEKESPQQVDTPVAVTSEPATETETAIQPVEVAETQPVAEPSVTAEMAEPVQQAEGVSAAAEAKKPAVETTEKTVSITSDVQGEEVVKPETTVAEATQAPVVAPAEEKPAAEKKGEETATASADEAPISIDDVQQLQIEARRSLFQGDLAAAESIHHKLIEQQPHNIDAYGQLGDIYLKKGDKEKAVEAYSHAAELLYKSRRRGMAWRVLDYIERISPEKARELRSRLMER